MIWLKNFNSKLYYLFSALIFTLLIPSFLCAWAEEEGTLCEELWQRLFVAIFYILRFPTHKIFWELIATKGPLVYIGSLIFNCFIYGLFLERIVYLIKKKT